MNYGAVLDGKSSAGETPTPVGEREFKWILDDTDFTDEFGKRY